MKRKVAIPLLAMVWFSVILTGCKDADNSEATEAKEAFKRLEVMPVDPGTVNLRHQYTFDDGTANDQRGTAHGTLVGGAKIIDGALVTMDQGDWMEMPGDIIDINSYSEVTLEAWYTPRVNANTRPMMLTYFGDSKKDQGNDGLFMTPIGRYGMSRAAISVGNVDNPWMAESWVDGPTHDDGLLHHMVATFSDTEVALYIDGVQAGVSSLAPHNCLSGISNNLAFLAKSGYEDGPVGKDPEWIGAIHKFSIYDIALSEQEVLHLFLAGD